MHITFYKYEGTGNDFVMIDNRELTFPKDNIKLVKHLCDRRFGIGCDGLILLENDDEADFKCRGQGGLRWVGQYAAGSEDSDPEDICHEEPDIRDDVCNSYDKLIYKRLHRLEFEAGGAVLLREPDDDGHDHAP